MPVVNAYAIKHVLSIKSTSGSFCRKRELCGDNSLDQQSRLKIVQGNGPQSGAILQICNDNVGISYVNEFQWHKTHRLKISKSRAPEV